MMIRWTLQLAFAIAAIMLTRPTLAATVTLAAERDATIFENNPDNASGAGNGLFAGLNGAGFILRGLIAFDLAGIPHGSTIQSVSLTLYLGQAAGSGGGTPGGGTETSTIDLHRTLAPWGEGATQDHDPPTDSLSMAGQGEESLPGDVTWNDRFFAADPVALWTTPGGDFASAVSSSLQINRSVNDPFTWPATATLISDVQGWLDNPASNHGWMLVNADEATSSNFRAFYTSDVATLSRRPQLTIAYASPGLTADFDADHDVDGADLVIWQRNLGVISGGTRSTGDATGEGMVNAQDLAAWRSEFGQPSQIGAPIPEPTSAIAVFFLALPLGASRRVSAASLSRQ